MEREKIKKQIGELVVFHRNKKELKQHDLAKLIGKSNTYLYELEQGLIMPSLRVVINIAEALNVDVSDFFRKKISLYRNTERYDFKSMGEMILNLRRRKGLMQTELGDMIDRTSNYICDIEKGRVFPSIEILYSIAETLGVEIWELLV